MTRLVLTLREDALIDLMSEGTWVPCCPSARTQLTRTLARAAITISDRNARLKRSVSPFNLAVKMVGRAEKRSWPGHV